MEDVGRGPLAQKLDQLELAEAVARAGEGGAAVDRLDGPAEVAVIGELSRQRVAPGRVAPAELRGLDGLARLGAEAVFLVDQAQRPTLLGSELGVAAEVFASGGALAQGEAVAEIGQDELGQAVGDVGVAECEGAEAVEGRWAAPPRLFEFEDHAADRVELVGGSQ